MDRAAIERRIVTVLFADIVGFTSLSERLDAEDMATVQDAYFGEVRAAIDRYGGRLEKFIGDAAMAVFGVPRTREDDAERAVRAGLALSSAIEALCPRIGLDAGQLRLRVGLNTGEVAYASGSDADGRVTGDTVNVAARLQAAAPIGAVLVGEATALAVAEAIELGSLEALELKGKAEPVRVALAHSVLPERSRDRAMGLLRAPLQGRATEMAILEAAAGRAVGGAVEAWCLVAPPGVGKSRLLEELERSIRSHADPGREPRVWRTRLRPEQVAPYRAVADLVGAAAQGVDLAASLAASRLPPERAAVLAGEVAALVGAAGEKASPSAPAEPAAGPGAAELGGRREARFEAWLEALEALARGDPAIWIVEDVHWAGGDLLAFLGFAAERPSAAGRLILATARPSLLERAGDWIGDGPVRRLDLDPLPAEDAGKLVRALVADALPPDLVVAVAERADGNPLFIEELLRTWASVGVLRPGHGDGAWELAVAPETVPLPQTVQQIYAAQLDDLPGAARLIARRASVAGRHFPVAALPRLGIEAPEEGLDVLLTRAFLAGPRREPITGDSYGYRHALLRDAGYASLARAERALLHVRFAAWLAEVAGDRLSIVAELIGGHYAAALVAASPLATNVAEGLDRPTVAALAAEHLELAAERALEVAAHEAARALLRRALEHTDERHRLDRARRLHRLGTVTAAGDMDEAMGHFEEARRLYADDLGGPEADRARDGYAAASAGAALLLVEQLRFRDGAALARQALAAIGEREDLATARLLLAQAHGDYYETNDVERALEEVAPVLEAARTAGDGRLELAARRLETYALAEGSLAGAEAFEALESVARQQASWDDVASCLTNRASYAEGRPEEAEALLAEAERIATAHGLTQRLAWVAHSRADLAFRSGDWDGALRHGLDAVALAEANGYHRVAVRTWFILVPIAAFRGDRPLLSRVAAWFDSRPDFPDSPYGRLMHGAIDLDLAAFGLRPSFVPEPERLVAAWQAPEGANFVAAMERIVDEWLANGLPEPARDALERIEARIGPYTEALGRSSCHLLRARWLAATGADAEVVAGKALEALEAARESDAPRWILRALESLEAAKGATREEEAEREAIEARLRGAPGTPEPPV